MSDDIRDVEVKESLPETVPYVVYEAAQARADKRHSIMCILLAISIVCVLALNIAWLIYESMYDTITYDQDGEGINNINTGTQGDVTREPTSKDKAEKEPLNR